MIDDAKLGIDVDFQWDLSRMTSTLQSDNPCVSDILQSDNSIQDLDRNRNNVNEDIVEILPSQDIVMRSSCAPA